MLRSPLARSKRRLLIAALTAACLSTLGLLAAASIRSPAEVAAAAAPPDATVLTAPVEYKVLATTIVMRGEFQGGRRISFTPVNVAETADSRGRLEMILTRSKVKVGDTVAAGKVLFEVSERPAFALRGAFPAYRDMLPGQTGQDVAQLQAGLRSLGYGISDKRGYFGASTTAAVQKFYRDRGYPVAITDAGSKDPTPPQSPTPQPSASSPPDPTKPASTLVTIVPRSELVFLPTLPARVVEFGAVVGDSVKEPLITFATGGLTLTARLDPTNEQLVAPGMKVAILSEASGYTGTGTVEGLGEKAQDEAGQAYMPVRIKGNAPWPTSLEGEDVRVTITAAGTPTKVLAVPVAAIASSADGRTFVMVVAADRTQHPVEVTAGVSADGWVEVTPVTGDLTSGDVVVTGT